MGCLESKAISTVEDQQNNNEEIPRKICPLTTTESIDMVSEIERVVIPLYENKAAQALANAVRLTGNLPFHEGLLIHTLYDRHYVAQSYPITLDKIKDREEGIDKIIKFTKHNQNADEYGISKVKYVPKKMCRMCQIVLVIEQQPNYYDLLSNNCQDFCNGVINALTSSVGLDIQENNNN